MCLAVPGQVIRCEGDQAVVDLHGSRLKVSTLLTPHVAEGDWVLVHAGFALTRLHRQEAALTFSVLAERSEEQDEDT